MACQNLELKEQYNAGVRWFDFWYQVTDNGKGAYLCHDHCDCHMNKETFLHTGCGRLTFESERDQILDCVVNHPSEFAIVTLQRDYRNKEISAVI